MSRRQARKRALQVLFQVDIGGADPGEAMDYLDHLDDEEFGKMTDKEDFAGKLVYGVLANSAFIDRVIAVVSKDWRLERMANVDRNLMRLALYEVFFCDDIPNNVSVNEAIDLGKIFGGPDSGKFINGILGKVIENIEEYTPEKVLNSNMPPDGSLALD
ncbi:MAG: transcription antitermination factor NusB [Desulfotomaculaceae bacterium]|nr:transcription antitermination factor NusB [Desulfotomaculaceae bacterium]MDD4766927.1 transcription antitermination factor NusB [Desulfotomaculaceae bacterium]